MAATKGDRIALGVASIALAVLLLGTFVYHVAFKPVVTEVDKFLVTSHEPIDSVYYHRDSVRLEIVTWSKSYVTLHYINLPIKWVRSISGGYIVRDTNGYMVCCGTLPSPYYRLIIDRALSTTLYRTKRPFKFNI